MNKEDMKISVIIAVYNQPRFLDLVLTGYGHQTDTNFDVIIADDGSGPEIAEVIESHKKRWPYALHHVWQEDKGWRKAAALNGALAVSDADYLIFTDGDCVPKPNFVSIHRCLSRPGHYITGAVVRISRPATDAVTPEIISSRQFFNPLWLAVHGGWRNYRKVLKPDVWASESIGLWLDWIWNARISHGRFALANSSCFRKDALALDGFNEKMIYGMEDPEFGVRLWNYGIKPTRLRVASTALHLDHDRPYANLEGVWWGNQLSKIARETGATSWR